MIRDLRPSDADRVVAFLQSYFPEEERLTGTRPELIYHVMRAVWRPDRRFFTGLARLFRHPVFRFLVVDEGEGLMATALLTFPGPSVFISTVATDARVRRKGYATALLEEARRYGRSLGRRYLVLGVLDKNAPARALYEQKLGYKPLIANSFMMLPRPEAPTPSPPTPPPGIRAYRAPDDPALLAIWRRLAPALYQEVLPRRRTGLTSSTFERGISGDTVEIWVADRGQGPEAAVRASWNPHVEAGHLSDPIVSPTADPALVQSLLRTAIDWSWAHGAQRLLTLVPAHNTPGRAALEREGFHEALGEWTLYCPIT